MGCSASLTEPPLYYETAGYQYCSEIRSTAEARASKATTIGVTLGVISAGLAVLGASIPSLDERYYFEEPGLFVTSAGAIIAPIAYYFLSEAVHAYEAEAQATRAMSLTIQQIRDTEAYERCLEIRANWVEEASNNISSDRIIGQPTQRALKEEIAAALSGAIEALAARDQRKLEAAQAELSSLREQAKQESDRTSRRLSEVERALGEAQKDNTALVDALRLARATAERERDQAVQAVAAIDKVVVEVERAQTPAPTPEAPQPLPVPEQQ